MNLPRTAAELSKSQVGKPLQMPYAAIADSTAIPPSQLLLLLPETFEFAQNGNRTEQSRESKDTLENDYQLGEKLLNLPRTAAELSKSIGRTTFCKYKFVRRQETFEFAQNGSRTEQIRGSKEATPSCCNSKNYRVLH